MRRTPCSVWFPGCGKALGLWRGDAMQDVGLLDSAAEERADAEITLGHGAEMVAELTDPAAAHPMRERLVAALMRALVAAGRDSEALLAYQRAREALADTLGVDPSPELGRPSAVLKPRYPKLSCVHHRHQA